MILYLLLAFSSLMPLFALLLWRKTNQITQEVREALIPLQEQWQQQNQQLQDQLLKQFSTHQMSLHSQLQALTERQHDHALQMMRAMNEIKDQLKHELQQYRQHFDAHQIQSFKLLQESLQQGIHNLLQHVNTTLLNNAENLGKRVDKLTYDTDERLKQISGQVEKRLMEGFEKTTATFADVLKRLALIDEAQKKITELSTNVVSLQEILADKRSRGAFGEVQLSALINNMLPAAHVKMQYTLSNKKRADCLLILPEPTGQIVIDAKFPLESYQQMMNQGLADSDRKTAEQQFRLDVRKHVQDIANKYIIPGETADGAMMFIPAEAIFAEIHSHYPDIIEEAQQLHVWLVSPTTLMAILTTARAVIKDAATRKQVHAIQEHLVYLAKDFARFQERMDNLANNIEKANNNIKDAQTSARKITSRFDKIEKVELDAPPLQLETSLE